MRGWTAKQAQVLACMQARIQRTEQRPSSREIAAHMRVAVQATYQPVRALARTGVLSTAHRHGGTCVSPDHMPHAGLPLRGQVATSTPILAAENLEGYLEIERL